MAGTPRLISDIETALPRKYYISHPHRGESSGPQLQSVDCNGASGPDPIRREGSGYRRTLLRLYQHSALVRCSLQGKKARHENHVLNSCGHSSARNAFPKGDLESTI